MRNSLRLSKEGKEEVDRARREMFMDRNTWIKQANTCLSTLRRFLEGTPISIDNFRVLCETIGIEDWKSVADLEDGDSKKVPELVQERLSSQTSKLAPDKTRCSLAVTGIFEPEDLQEIEGALDLLRKLMARGTVLIKNQDGQEIREIRHLDT